MVIITAMFINTAMLTQAVDEILVDRDRVVHARQGRGDKGNGGLRAGTLLSRRSARRPSFTPIPSLWGHSAGGGGNAADNTFINDQVKAFLEHR